VNSGATAPPGPTRKRLGFGTVLWALIPALSFGLLAPVPFAHAAAKLRQPRMWVVTGAYSIGSLCGSPVCSPLREAGAKRCSERWPSCSWSLPPPTRSCCAGSSLRPRRRSRRWLPRWPPGSGARRPGRSRRRPRPRAAHRPPGPAAPVRRRRPGRRQPRAGADPGGPARPVASGSGPGDRGP